MVLIAARGDSKRRTSGGGAPDSRVVYEKGTYVCVFGLAVCPQFQLVPGPQSEDFLALNIWTPAWSANDDVPVMVWIHGGGFQLGAGSSLHYKIVERLAGRL